MQARLGIVHPSKSPHCFADVCISHHVHALTQRPTVLQAQAPARRTASQQLSQQSPPLYPEFDKGPLPPVDYGYSRQSNSSSANLMDAPVPQQRQQQASLLDAYQPSPQVELQLGPQEVEVSSSQSLPVQNAATSLCNKCSLGHVGSW